MGSWLTIWFFLPLIALPILVILYTLGVWKRLSVNEPIWFELTQFWLWLRALGYGLAWTFLLFMFGSAVALITVGSVEGTPSLLKVLEVAVSLPYYLAGLVALGIDRILFNVGVAELGEFPMPIVWYCGTPLMAVALLLTMAILISQLKRAHLRKTANH